MKYRYDIHTGVTRVKTKAAIALTTIGLMAGGSGLSMALFGTAHALAPPNWNVNGSYTIAFTCSTGCSGTYTHDATISNENALGNFDISGGYPAGGPYSYAWNGTGNNSGNSITTSVNYTVGAPGTHMDMTGTVAPSGSMSGTWTDNYGGTRTGTWATASGKATSGCVPTGFVRDGIDLTARQIGGNVNNDLNATGCNIGVYYDKNHTGNVQHGNVFGANYFGVVVDGGQGNVNVNVSQSQIHNIGEVPFNGTQHGVGVYYYGQGTSGNATGQVSQDHVYNYQKGGIVINGQKASVPVFQDTVNGLGPVNYIAQNGIQISRGASGDVYQNTVTGNAYTGANQASSGGILIFGGEGSPLVTNVRVYQNNLDGNDVGIYLANYNASGSAGPTTQTKIDVNHNQASNSAVTNTTGNGGTQAYQAGISDSGNHDSITFNRISGNGYAQQTTSSAFVRPIDVSPPYAISPSLSFNTFNGNPYP